MKKLLLIKYASEIFLKGLNKKKFENHLRERIAENLRGLDFKFVIDEGRYFIETTDMEEAIARIVRIFGIKEVCEVVQVEKTMEAISEEALRQAKEFDKKTFKVITNRANKSFPMNSLDVSREIGGYILDNSSDLTVSVKNPEEIIYVEIRANAYVFSKKIKGAGGMPYGINGSTMLMLSGGIDSPVAGYLMARRGTEVSSVYFHSHPYTSERAKEKVIDLAKILASYTGQMKLYIVPFTEIQMKIMELCPEDELTIIMRRFMMRVSCTLAERNKIQSVSTGESIGQVASQTMEGLIVSTDVADRPVFRPLIAMDKEDIMDIARKVGTYDTSILPYEDCCTIFVPKHPKTKPVLEYICRSEENLDIEELVKEAVDNTEILLLKHENN